MYTKVCTKCKKEKSLSEFSLSRHHYYQHEDECDKCKEEQLSIEL